MLKSYKFSFWWLHGKFTGTKSIKKVIINWFPFLRSAPAGLFRLQDYLSPVASKNTFACSCTPHRVPLCNGSSTHSSFLPSIPGSTATLNLFRSISTLILLSERMASAEALLEIQAPDMAAFLVFALMKRHVDGETLCRFESAHVDVGFPTVVHLKVFPTKVFSSKTFSSYMILLLYIHGRLHKIVW